MTYTLDTYPRTKYWSVFIKIHRKIDPVNRRGPMKRKKNTLEKRRRRWSTIKSRKNWYPTRVTFFRAIRVPFSRPIFCSALNLLRKNPLSFSRHLFPLFRDFFFHPYPLSPFVHKCIHAYILLLLLLKIFNKFPTVGRNFIRIIKKNLIW